MVHLALSLTTGTRPLTMIDYPEKRDSILESLEAIDEQLAATPTKTDEVKDQLATLAQAKRVKFPVANLYAKAWTPGGQHVHSLTRPVGRGMSRLLRSRQKRPRKLQAREADSYLRPRAPSCYSVFRDRPGQGH